MKFKSLLLTLLLFSLIVFKSFAEADPGSAGLTLNKSIYKMSETGTLQVLIGNYSSGLKAGSALSAYDATFTITIPYTLKVSGPLDFSAVPFAMSISSYTTNQVGSTVIVLIVPNGIGIGKEGKVSIPFQAVKEDLKILYVTVKTDANLGYPSSGNAIPNNDLQSAPVAVITALPVRLISFRVVKINGTADLFWSTAEESNSDYFDVEHSPDSKNWTSIRKLSAGGDAKYRQEYNFVHENPGKGDNYYRLKMVDRDSTFGLSTIRSVRFDNMVSFVIYPNPVSDVLTIETPDWPLVKNVQLINTDGASVYNSGLVLTKTVNVKELIQGIYFIRLTKSDGLTTVKKILISR